MKQEYLVFCIGITAKYKDRSAGYHIAYLVNFQEYL